MVSDTRSQRLIRRARNCSVFGGSNKAKDFNLGGIHFAAPYRRLSLKARSRRASDASVKQNGPDATFPVCRGKIILTNTLRFLARMRRKAD